MRGNIEELFAQVLDFQGNPVVSFLSKQFVDRIRRQRLEVGRTTLIHKMQRGKPWAFRDDEVMSLVHDFLRAAEEGVARANLEWMAELIANGIAQSVLTEDEVRHLMRTVSDLASEEMRALAALLRAKKNYVLPLDLKSQPTVTWVACQAYRLACSELGGRVDDGDEVDEATAAIEATFAALQRTGFVVPISVWSGTMYGGTPRLAKLASLIEAGSPGV